MQLLISLHALSDADTSSDYLWCCDPLDGTTNFTRYCNTSPAIPKVLMNNTCMVFHGVAPLVPKTEPCRIPPLGGHDSSTCISQCIRFLLCLEKVSSAAGCRGYPSFAVSVGECYCNANLTCCQILCISDLQFPGLL